MKRRRLLAVIPAVILYVAILGVGFIASSSWAQLTEAESKTATLSSDYEVTPNIVYLTASGYEAKLDVYQPAGENSHPTLIYFHGGGWVAGNKESAMLETAPFLEKGWAVVNVEYRLAKISLAPAAVEDCRCALHWVYAHATDYKFDTDRIVVMGHSAGGHLALTTGMLPVSAGLDRECPPEKEVKVAAIIDWFGITDVGDLFEGPNKQDYAVMWVGSQVNREEIAKRVSPLTYVRAGVPPILLIQGDADKIVPYSHSVRLHEALDRSGIPNELVTIPGGHHGGFSHAETDMIYTHIWAFLARYLPKSQ
jgi:acetyl esterase/lipase